MGGMKQKWSGPGLALLARAEPGHAGLPSSSPGRGCHSPYISSPPLLYTTEHEPFSSFLVEPELYCEVAWDIGTWDIEIVLGFLVESSLNRNGDMSGYL